MDTKYLQERRAARSLAHHPMRRLTALPGLLRLKHAPSTAKSARILRRPRSLPTPAARVSAGRNQEKRHDTSNGETRAAAAARARSRLHNHGHGVRFDRVGRRSRDLQLEELRFGLRNNERNAGRRQGVQRTVLRDYQGYEGR